MTAFSDSLSSGFVLSAVVLERPALQAGGETLSYAELHGRAAAIATALRRELADDDIRWSACSPTGPCDRSAACSGRTWPAAPTCR